MRAFLATLVAAGVVVSGIAGVAVAKSDPRARTAQSTLVSVLTKAMRPAGHYSSAYVVDLNTGGALFSSAAGVARLPASVEKLYTTTTALLRFGPNATLQTAIHGVGSVSGTGAWHGTLYLKGGGDPTFGSAFFDAGAYGAGATIQRLVANLIHQTGIKSFSGQIVGDGSYFDSLPGTSESGFQFDPYMEGALSGLAFNRGLVNSGSGYLIHPALYAAQQMAAALRAAHVHVPRATPLRSGVTPASAPVLATVHSPRIATLIKMTNVPSDNFFAEMLLKGLGAQFGGAGTTAAGAAVVRAQLRSSFGIQPTLVDGSGLSRADSTSPQQVVTLLQGMATNQTFVSSLAVAGETGTLQHEMTGTIAQGRCRGKTGTLTGVANLAGYCTALDGHTLAFAFLMNGVNSAAAHDLEQNMAVALARYDG
jgi:D-alanyl-D-alanine carboxypeptidase/D-alanyl-D-alanine-endopeptidase (penicillin-binding protein 4)